MHARTLSNHSSLHLDYSIPPSLYKSFFHLPFLFLFPHFHSLTSAYRYVISITSLTIMQRLIVAVPRHILRFFSLILPILFSRIELFLSFIFSFCFIFKNICHLQLKLASFEKFIFFMTNISHIIDYVNCACILYSQLFFFFFFLTFQCTNHPFNKFKFRIYKQSFSPSMSY